jgi:trehalose synthase-fused probable maltokinase
MASRPLRSEPEAIVALLSGPGRSDVARFLTRQRWFAAKTRGVQALAVLDWAVLDPAVPLLLLLLSVDGDRYYVPIAVAGETAPEAALVQADGLSVVDAHDDPRFGRRLLAAIAAGRTIEGRAGRFHFQPTAGWAFPADPDATAVRRLRGEQSNTSIVLGDLVLKSLRRPAPGLNPDLEMLRFLTTKTAFPHVPRLAGSAEYEGGEEPAALAVLQEFVPNTGDGWGHVVSALAARGPGGAEPLITDLRRLGAITGGLHVALASDETDPAFRPERVTAEDVARWREDIGRDLRAEEVRRCLADRAEDDPAAAALAVLDTMPGALSKIRLHGDYHLGQVLKTPDGFVIIDFEGEPARPLPERRRKESALRDVAGMLRSLDYAAHAVAFREPEADRPARLAALTAWEAQARRAFLDAYHAAALEGPAPLVPRDRALFERACAPFELQKACYELRYELDNRPTWVGIPAAGIGRLLGRAGRRNLTRG